MIPLFGVSVFQLGLPLLFLLFSLYSFGITLGLLVTSDYLDLAHLLKNIAWASLFFLAPLGCIYYPIDVLPIFLQVVAKGLPLVHIFEEMRSILLNGDVNYMDIIKSISDIYSLFCFRCYNFLYFIFMELK